MSRCGSPSRTSFCLYPLPTKKSLVHSQIRSAELDPSLQSSQLAFQRTAPPLGASLLPFESYVISSKHRGMLRTHPGPNSCPIYKLREARSCLGGLEEIMHSRKGHRSSTYTRHHACRRAMQATDWAYVILFQCGRRRPQNLFQHPQLPERYRASYFAGNEITDLTNRLDAGGL